MSSRPRRRTPVVAAAVSSTLAASLSLAVLAASPSQAEPGGGSIDLVLRTPRGVAANVVLSGAGDQVFAKGPQGRRHLESRGAAPGAYRVLAPQVVDDGVLYRASYDRSATVKRGAATKVVVTYLPVGGASQLHASHVTDDAVALQWDDAGTPVRLRRTAGNMAALAVTQGTAVVHGAGQATDAVEAGRSYTYALFSKVDGRWVGPLALKVRTASGARPAAVAMPRSSTTISRRDLDRVGPAGSGLVDVQLRPGTRRPVIGSGVSIVPSSSMPGGFVGRVESVALDGTSYEASVGGLGDVVDYLDVNLDIDHVGSLPLTPMPVPVARAAQARTLAQARKVLGPTFARRDPAPVGCNAMSSGTTITDWSGSLDPSGYVMSSLRRVGSAPATATYDMEMTLDGAFSADVDSVASDPSGYSSCFTIFEPVYARLLARPVPIVLAMQPIIAVQAEDGTKVTGLQMQGVGGFRALGDWGVTDQREHQLLGSGSISAGEVTKAGGIMSGIGAYVGLGSFADIQNGSSPLLASGTLAPAVSQWDSYFTGPDDPRADSCLGGYGQSQAQFSLDPQALLGGDPDAEAYSPDFQPTLFDDAPSFFPDGCENTPNP